jgi:hypothetical protein
MEAERVHIFENMKVRIHDDITGVPREDIRRLLRENGALVTESKDPDVICVALNFESVRLRFFSLIAESAAGIGFHVLESVGNDLL